MDFQNELKEIVEQEAVKMIAFGKAIDFCRNTLSGLEQAFLAKQNCSIEDEINYFKIVKQEAQSQLFYYWALREYQAHYPPADTNFQKSYIKSKRKDSRAFLRKNLNFQRYLNMGAYHLDHLYFTCSGGAAINGPQGIDVILDPGRHTVHDLLLSRIRANELLLKFYEKELEQLKLGDTNEIARLKWKGSKVSFTELVYGLYHSGTFGEKEIPVKVIAQVLAKCFQLPPFDIYDTYGAIKNRKKDRSVFLNRMLQNFTRAMEDADY
ncbi:RteC domain-containing protein [Maribacter sp. 2307ULW6-5]|uniref:RteC domain-containing protein n=1 Tax=Maribacter sp. 2307ULW6-5 TaxID=3386275 RepID=UPI0039BD4FE1